MYEQGDIVKVWSLQSFSGGGFLNGERAIVRQDQQGESVLLIVTRNIDTNFILDTSYEVYHQQIKLVKKSSESDKERVKLFLELNKKIREWEVTHKKIYTPHHHAPEFFFDDNMEIQFDDKNIKYPEMFI